MKNTNDEMLMNEEQEMEYNITAKVSKEEKEEIIKISSDKKMVRYLVDQYQQSQAYRIKAQNQARSLLQGYDQSTEDQFSFITKEIKNAEANESLNKKYIDIITDNISVCRWMKSIMGIGPLLSAYLYSAFDPKVATYATEFLSYAGLNDNNNPWLGTEKATAIVKEAVAYRKEKFDKITTVIEESFVGTKYKKIVTALKKIGKSNEVDYCDIIESNEGHLLKDLPIDASILPDYVRWLAYPNSCDDILIDYVAAYTGRKFSNVKKGAINNWKKKKSKTKVPTVDDLTSYLAKPPYNTDLKKRMYLIGESFIKVSNKEKSLYGSIYKQKRIEYTRKNDAGEYADQAAGILLEKNIKDPDTRERLESGKLTDGHIMARAKRYAVKLFISHVFEAMYYAEYGEEPPKTYVIAHMGHHDYIPPEVDYKPYINGEL